MSSNKRQVKVIAAKELFLMDDSNEESSNGSDDDLLSNPLPCNICEVVLPRKSLLLRHMKLFHETELNNTSSTSSSSSLSSSGSSSSSSSTSSTEGTKARIKYPCPDCGESFLSGKDMEDHGRLAHQMLRLIRCKSCGLYGSARPENEGNFECTQCEQKTNSMKTDTPEQQKAINDISTSRVQKTVTFSNKISVHSDQDQSFEAVSKKIMDDIADKIKTEPVDINAIDSNPTFVIKLPLPRTQKKARNDSTYMPFNISKGHVCEVCHRHYKHASTLSLHKKKHTGEFKYKCEFCDKTFLISETYKCHLRVHTKEKPYVCSYCEKSFSQASTLTQHIRIHTGEKPYRCQDCGKQFSVKDYLNKHIRTHTGEKPYTCDICEKSFTQPSALKLHARSHLDL